MGNLFPKLGMVAAPALGDIVQEQRHIKRGPRHDGPGDFRTQGLNLVQLPFFNPRQNADCADGMLIDGIIMVHVVLGLGHRAAEIGNKAAQNPSLVHPPQGGFRIMAGGQHLHKGVTRRRIAPQPGIDQLPVTGDQFQGIGVDIVAMAVGDRKNPDHVGGIFLKILFVGNRQAPAHQPESLDLGFQGQRRPVQQTFFLVALFQQGAKNPGQVTDILGDQEVMLHEAFDLVEAGVILIPELFRQRQLHVKGHPFLRPSIQQVQMLAYRPQKIFRPPERSKFLAGKNFLEDQAGDILDPVQEPRQPEQGMEVPKPPFALLQVGLHYVARVSHPLVAPVPFLQLVLDKLPSLAGDDFFPEFFLKLFKQLFFTRQIAGIQQRCLDADVAFRHLDAVIPGAQRMADRQPQIPQHLEHKFGNFFHPRPWFIGDQEHYIDVRVKCQLAPPVAASSDQADLLGGGPAAGPEHLLAGQPVEGSDGFVHHIAQTPGGLKPGDFSLFQGAGDLGFLVQEFWLQKPHHPGPLDVMGLPFHGQTFDVFRP